jgi:hypothetical protein
MKKALIYIIELAWVVGFAYLILTLINNSWVKDEYYKKKATEEYSICLKNNNNQRVMIKKGDYKLQLGKTNYCILPDQQFRSVLVILDLGIEVPVKISNIEHIK